MKQDWLEIFGIHLEEEIALLFLENKKLSEDFIRKY